jgi:putative ABC transport system permease protein
MAFTVVQRRREIGIRRALGAGGGRVTAEIFLGGLRLSAFGIVLGLPLGFLGMNLLRGLGMPEVPWPLLMTITSVLVLAVTSLATFIPASRASRVDPARTLRFE